MPTILALALVGQLQSVPAQTAVTNDTVTNTRPDIVKPLKSQIGTDQNPQEATKRELSENPRRLPLTLSLDVKGKPFGGYDAEFIGTVQQHWHHLFSIQQADSKRTGRVALQFNLHQDGHVTDMKVLKSSGGDLLSLLCENAVLGPSPFPCWPAEMRKGIVADFRTMKLTFNYLPDEPGHKQ